MALARFALKNLQQRLASPLSHGVQNRSWGSELLRRSLSSSSAAAAGEEKSQGGREVSVSEGGKKSKLFPRRRRRGGSLWNWKRNTDGFPPLWEFFPSGLGNALIEASENINRLMENLSPSQLIGRVKEQDDCYKLRFNVPGLGKDDVKITVEEGILTIKGEHKEEQEEEGSDDDEHWSARSYGYYNSSMMLPDDAKVDEIKAEMKNGVLTVLIPRTEKPKKDVKEIRIH
ncbi:hypothetical protein M9H77_29284 [Catharanthus roseus]|uniref:Uncharacterized protein n=1 Tax=Catharanthus roseus TaxID=4058 RepID=A0ACC0AID2_CATRO|nr:hypothetical protein M9H77_29284 [Catharanthus roseus]